MQRIGFTVSPGFQTMSLAVISVFEFANMEIGKPVYDVHLLSETGGSIRTSMGMSITAEPFDDTSFDTLIVSGTTAIEPSTPGLIKFVQQALGAISAGRRNLYRRLHSGRSRRAR
jgi:transcriptional regulator GlxA family with amidase domain